ncbi:helix-turn-helix transcriptional regulator [Sphingomonas solaris]|uniref:Helix-turn-helix transcriptional regulator n=1 Tax=Alterirhizorhabdus solaris TaxID=2529389 RepID=A0A558QVK8_9SPHN|nr:helix-turn-helix transcriptional regulator [Sphingomonas solaris]TVV71148.1 helix-turn-helix transcriptional regulator [Sphingomonas solaris]
MRQPLPKPTLHHLEQLMDSLLAGVILMDPAGVILSANPAALKMHGIDRVEDLGATADDYAARFSLRYRNHHRLTRREYPLVRLLAGENFADLIVEVAPLDSTEPRWVHQVRDVTMDEDGGEPDCLALVIHDVSEQFDAEDRFEAMFQANPAPALILRVSDQRYIRANRGFLDLSGYTQHGLIGKSLFDLDLLAGVERRDYVKERIAAGQTVPQLEAELPLAGGDTKLVILAGQRIEVADERCLLFTFADLEPRRRAETALQASEQHFATVFEMAPVAMVVTEQADHRILNANEAFRRMTDHPRHRLIGRVADDLQLWNDAAQRRGLEAEIAARGGFRCHDVRVLHKDGQAIECLVSAEGISLHGDHCVLWLYQDITARRHSEVELVEAIEAVMKDANWLSRSIMDKLATLRDPGKRTGDAPPPADLSPREREVLELICTGMDDKAIAERLGLSRNTVRNHVSRLYGRIGVNRRSAAVVWARERGIGGSA